MKKYYIGVMSGTSMDGIDVALVNIENSNQIEFIDSYCFPMPATLKAQLIILCQHQQITLQQLGELDHQLGLLFAQSINNLISKNKIAQSHIVAIGCHGQTIYHSPDGNNPFTMQIGDANIIAAKTGITTVADFRRKDMAFGGQGAPLVPAFHQAIFADQQKNRVILNIGGISNITVLIPGHPIIGYDTGPGNLLLDGWIKQHCNQDYDNDARWAKSGKVNSDLLSHLLRDPYFSLPYPKSTGRERFNLAWLNSNLTDFQLSPQDIQATLVVVTALSITNAIKQLSVNISLPNELYVCGGGAKNPLIMQQLSANLPAWSVAITDKQGISSDDMEAIAFAWLAYCRINNLPSNIPSVTGANKKVSLGVIYPQ